MRGNSQEIKDGVKKESKQLRFASSPALTHHSGFYSAEQPQKKNLSEKFAHCFYFLRSAHLVIFRWLDFREWPLFRKIKIRQEEEEERGGLKKNWKK